MAGHKPLGGKCYGSIAHFPGSRMGPGDHKCHEGQKRIATEKARDKHDFIIVQEKLDGSSVGVARIDGAVVPLTRAGYVADTSPYEQHWIFGKWVQDNHARFMDLLADGERLCGEWLAQAHGTRYALPHEPFVAFDLFREGKRVLLKELGERVTQFGFTIPRLIHAGPPLSIEAMLAVIEVSGHGAIDSVEGAVWRVERKGVVDFLAKYVRPTKQDGCYLPEVSGKEAVWNWRPA